MFKRDQTLKGVEGNKAVDGAMEMSFDDSDRILKAKKEGHTTKSKVHDANVEGFTNELRTSLD